MSGLDPDTIKEFSGFLKWYHSNFNKNSKIVDERILKLIEKWEEEDDLEMEV